MGSLLAKVAECYRFGVNGPPHQTLSRIAKPLRITAVSIDGIVDGLELESDARHLLPRLLAVQFCPEIWFRWHGEP